MRRTNGEATGSIPPQLVSRKEGQRAKQECQIALEPGLKATGAAVFIAS